MIAPRTLLTALLAPAFGVALGAQVAVQLRGELTDGSASGCYYCPGFAHVIKVSGVPLQSSTLNLAAFMDQQVYVQGTWDGSRVTVSSISLTPESFSVSGNGSIGNRFRLISHGQPGELALNVVALGASFSVPYLDLGFQLDPLTSVVQGMGPLNGAGEFKTDLDIPNDPGFVGLRVFGQGVILDAGGNLLTTNPDAKQITP
ncbi:MAG: hypothetical protein KDE27_27955 [Planctomycetes bacterium]|nr:hypothetical protein [Planctomycetota bacterium]